MKLRPITQKKNKKGQLDFGIITFAIVVIGLLFLAPIILKVVRTTVQPFGDALNNTNIGGGEEASGRSLYVLGVFVNFWDAVVFFAFALQVILLLVSALFIDTNPFFIILYILILVLLLVFAPGILESVNNIYDSADFAQEVALLGFMDFLRTNFGLVITAIAILSMVVIYAKVRYFPSR